MYGTETQVGAVVEGRDCRKYGNSDVRSRLEGLDKSLLECAAQWRQDALVLDRICVRVCDARLNGLWVSDYPFMFQYLCGPHAGLRNVVLVARKIIMVSTVMAAAAAAAGGVQDHSEFRTIESALHLVLVEPFREVEMSLLRRLEWFDALVKFAVFPLLLTPRFLQEGCPVGVYGDLSRTLGRLRRAVELQLLRQADLSEVPLDCPSVPPTYSMEFRDRAIEIWGIWFDTWIRRRLDSYTAGSSLPSAEALCADPAGVIGGAAPYLEMVFVRRLLLVEGEAGRRLRGEVYRVWRDRWSELSDCARRVATRSAELLRDYGWAADIHENVPKLVGEVRFGLGAPMVQLAGPFGGPVDMRESVFFSELVDMIPWLSERDDAAQAAQAAQATEPRDTRRSKSVAVADDPAALRLVHMAATLARISGMEAARALAQQQQQQQQQRGPAEHRNDFVSALWMFVFFGMCVNARGTRGVRYWLQFVFTQMHIDFVGEVGEPVPLVDDLLARMYGAPDMRIPLLSLCNWGAARRARRRKNEQEIEPVTVVFRAASSVRHDYAFLLVMSRLCTWLSYSFFSPEKQQQLNIPNRDCAPGLAALYDLCPALVSMCPDFTRHIPCALVERVYKGANVRSFEWHRALSRRRSARWFADLAKLSDVEVEAAAVPPATARKRAVGAPYPQVALQSMLRKFPSLFLIEKRETKDVGCSLYGVERRASDGAVTCTCSVCFGETTVVPTTATTSTGRKRARGEEEGDDPAGFFLPCGHYFCTHCVVRMFFSFSTTQGAILNQRRICPCCRGPCYVNETTGIIPEFIRSVPVNMCMSVLHMLTTRAWSDNDRPRIRFFHAIVSLKWLPLEAHADISPIRLLFVTDLGSACPG